MKTRMRKAAGLAACLFAALTMTASAYAATPVPSQSEGEKEGYNRHEQKVIVKDNYDKDELTASETIVAPAKVSAFKTTDVEYRLVAVEWEDMTITDRSIGLKSITDYGYTTVIPKAPDVKVVEYMDERSGEVIDARLPLISLDLKGRYESEGHEEIGNAVLENAIVNKETDKSVSEALSGSVSELQRAQLTNNAYGFMWREDLSIWVKVFLTGEYLKFGNLYIPYDEAAPTFASYESAILKSVGHNDENYRITGSHWSGAVKVEDGVEVRYGYYTGERCAANYVAIYEDTVTLPDVEGFRATLTYEAYTETDKTTPIVIGSIGAAAVGVPAFLFIKKKKEVATNED